MKHFFRVLLILPLLLSTQSSPAERLRTGENGEVITGELTWRLAAYDEKWRVHHPELSEAENAVPETRIWEGEVRMGDNIPPLEFRQTQNADVSTSASHFTFRALPSGPVPIRILAVEAKFPAESYTGRPLQIDKSSWTFPETPPEKPSLFMKRIEEIRIPKEDGVLVLSGNHVMMQILDRRTFGDPHFYLRFYFPSENPLTEPAELKIRLDSLPYPFTSLSLHTVANRDFSDEKAGDRSGGWTDQGPDNDLRSFDPAELKPKGVNFQIPKDGNRVLVLSRHSERSDTSSAELELPPENRFLYLLHAGAWLTRQPVGTIHFHTDAGVVKQEVIRNRDVNDWWRPAAAENAAIAWSGNNPQSRIGLYVSRFELPEERVNKITLEAESNAVWMIAAASVSPQYIPLPRESSFFMQANETWRPFTDRLEILPGSILDFSSTDTPDPAGSTGPLRASEDGTFYYENAPEQRVKLFGTSLNFGANFLEKKDADRLAVHFRRMGYNTVRFHHHDVMLFGGWEQRDYKIDPGQLAKLDYLFYRCKQEGLAISTELYQMRRAFSPEVRELIGDKDYLFKGVLPFSDAAMNDWKQFARDLLGRKNPHTGLTWAEDPALTTVCPVNEDTLWVKLANQKAVQDLAVKAYQNQYGGEHPEKNPARFNRFVLERHLAADAEMKRFLKEELGYRGLVTGNNWKNYAIQTPLRMQYDYVDNHGYWDHPSFPKQAFKLPANFSQKSATANLAYIPRRLFLSRVKGKPFAVTEYNFALPNRFRSEGGALMGTYAARQDWDLVFRFGWAHDQESTLNVGAPGTMSATFDMSSDPVNRLSEAFVYVLWLRGDLDPFEKEAVYTVRSEAFHTDRPFQIPPKFPENASLAGLEMRVSSTFDETPARDDRLAFTTLEPQERYDVRTPGGRSLLEKKGNLLVDTPTSKAAVLQDGTPDAEFIPEFSGGPASVLVASRDGKPLDESERILVLHLTDVLAEEIEFDSPQRFSVRGPGKLPHLLRSGKATVRIPDNGTGALKAFAVDISGKRLEELPLVRENSHAVLEVNTTPENREPRMVYEIIRE